MYRGSWKIDDVLTFGIVTHNASTGALTDDDANPTYRIYEDEIATPLLTGSLAKLDDANTTGFYTKQITLSAANGFEKGKSYTIYMESTVNSIKGGGVHFFQIEAEVDANVVSGIVGTVTSVTNRVTANVDQIGGDAQSATDLKDFADAGYDPATNKVQGVVLVDTTTTNTDMVTEPKSSIKKNTQRLLMFKMIDSSGNSATSKTVTVQFSKDGGAFASSSNSVSEVSNGWYKITATATELNADVVAVRASATGCLDTDQVLYTYN